MLGDSFTTEGDSVDSLENMQVDNSEKKISIHDLLCDSPESPNLMERMATLPIINSLGNVYEKSKTIRVVKYSAESLLKPVLDTLEPALAPLDRFACNQLDKLGFPNNEARRRIAQQKSLKKHNSQDELDKEKKEPKKWHQVVGSKMGSMILTEDMARGIRYCMQWLQHATQVIDAQITHLLRFLAKLGVSLGSQLSNAIGLEISDTLIPANDDLKTLLATIKRQVAEILKKVVQVVGKYAAVCLPGDARNSVKSFILSLPNRWASVNTRFTGTCQTEQVKSSNVPEGMEEAQKVLTLATESTNMLKGIQSVIESSVEFYDLEQGDMDVNFNLKTSIGDFTDDDEFQDSNESSMDQS